jgi:mannose-6-phosphate isomerase-like protein (cupin superfamily)
VTVVDRRPTEAARRSALEQCTGDADAFLDRVWSRVASIHTGVDPSGFGDLLGLDDVDRILSTTSPRTPSFRLVRADETIPESAYTRSGTTGSRPVSGMADPARVFELFRQGATIVLQGLHRYWEPVSRFARELEVELGHPCQVNAYVTPPGAQGLALHDDPHDVFVLQAFGRKSWEIHAAPSEREREPIRAEIGPGDCIYMPAGTPHAASTQTSLSGHLTVGVHLVRWSDVVDEVWKRARGATSLAEPVPAGWHRATEAFAHALEEKVTSAAAEIIGVDTGALAEERAERFLSTRLPLLRGALVDQAALVEMGDDTVLARRPGSVCELRMRGGELVALLGDRRLEMPAWLAPAMRRIAGSPRLRLGDLADVLPDAESRAVLGRRLVREGLLRPLP